MKIRNPKSEIRKKSEPQSSRREDCGLGRSLDGLGPVIDGVKGKGTNPITNRRYLTRSPAAVFRHPPP